MVDPQTVEIMALTITMETFVPIVEERAKTWDFVAVDKWLEHQ